MMLTLASYENHKSGTGGIATYFGMLRSGSPGEELIADEAPAHILPDDNEHLADLDGAGERCSTAALSLIVISCSLRRYTRVTTPARESPLISFIHLRLLWRNPF